MSKWHVGNGGFTIVVEEIGNSLVIAEYRATTFPLDVERYEMWLGDAEVICAQHNAEVWSAQCGLPGAQNTKSHADIYRDALDEVQP